MLKPVEKPMCCGEYPGGLIVGCGGRVCKRLTGSETGMDEKAVVKLVSSPEMWEGEASVVFTGKVCGDGMVREANFSWSMVVRVLNLESMS